MTQGAGLAGRDPFGFPGASGGICSLGQLVCFTSISKRNYTHFWTLGLAHDPVTDFVRSQRRLSSLAVLGGSHREAHPGRVSDVASRPDFSEATHMVNKQEGNVFILALPLISLPQRKRPTPGVQSYQTARKLGQYVSA